MFKFYIIIFQNLDFIPLILGVFGFYSLKFGVFGFYTLKFQNLSV